MPFLQLHFIVAPQSGLQCLASEGRPCCAETLHPAIDPFQKLGVHGHVNDFHESLAGDSAHFAQAAYFL